jgi:hypothetical protein
MLTNIIVTTRVNTVSLHESILYSNHPIQKAMDWFLYSIWHDESLWISFVWNLDTFSHDRYSLRKKKFDLSLPKNQIYVHELCQKLLQEPNVIEEITNNRVFGKNIQRDVRNFDCFMEEFKSWLEYYKQDFPVRREEFDKKMQQFAIHFEESGTITLARKDLSRHNLGFVDGKLVFFKISFKARGIVDKSLDEAMNTYNFWEDYAKSINK